MNGDAEFSFERTPANSLCLLLTFFAVLFTIAGGGLIVYWFARNHGMVLGLTALRNVLPPREEPVPDLWTINDTYVIPFHRRSGRMLGFTVAEHLESLYRHNGIENRLLGNDEYLALSQESLASAIEAFCATDPQSPYCIGGANENVFWTDRVSKSAVIPETAEGVPGLSNPLKVTVGAVKSSRGLFEVKRTLLYSFRPLLLSIPRLRKRAWVVSDGDSGVACPGNIEARCIQRVVDIDSEWFESPVSETVFAEPNVVPLVGYNDNFVLYGYDGGFIVKNNWGAVGHTREFLLGKLPADIDRLLCPNPRDWTQWIPATRECLEETQDPQRCSRDIRSVYGTVRVGAVPLRCIDAEFCDKEALYVMERKNGTTGFITDELTRPSVLEVKGEVVKRVTLNLPLEFAWSALEPVEQRHESLLACGYVMLPYALMKHVMGMECQGFAGWHVYDVQLDWDERSYPEKGSFDYSYVKNSTRTVDLGDLGVWDEYMRQML